MKKTLKRLCTGFLTLVTVVTVNNPASVSMLSGLRKPQIRF